MWELYGRDRGALLDMTEGFIPQHGGFRKLRSFQAAQLAYDGTVIFCDRFIDKRSRTHDQMVQAARSGVQNIAEGSLASATSKETELKLTNVARASLGELLLDYEDFLRQHVHFFADITLLRPGNLPPDEDRRHTTLPIPNHRCLRSQFLPGL